MEIDPMLVQIAIAGATELIFVPILVAIMVKIFGKRLDRFDEKRERARAERAEEKRRLEDQREAERSMILAIARTMLLENYERCMDKGYYSLEEREVFGRLYLSYKSDNGNGVIDMIADRIRKLPLEPPDGIKED